jgi:hypothetical protein
MFNDNALLAGLIVVFGLIIFVKFLVWHFNKNADQHSQVLNSIKGSLFIYGIMVVGLWLALPASFNFRMYDYPQEFKSLAEVHAYLKEQSKMLERLADVVRWFLFTFVMFFLSDLYRFTKLIFKTNVNAERHE